ncbi:preprotein translocase subunit SecE [Wolbachia endosymbiont of Cruorifilaria tuberocauda]|uniref:preprotein translocase subunit SecE n=1 Tax=Wolbachia endosymbiont of Cruorifilaria tuberocauda TaxID=1812111 RepID=UPI00158BB55F|nr:preprotein translocase subunit SecE [Wolbachia endosymbiont of Cruorifilaria tuberocauda]QKX01882.1 preprotein translocase subunit SecE [Wolbachia endosymbiont of Cruorifilaria tuberocauda]
MLKSLNSFFCGIKQEIKKVTWAKKQEVFSSLFVIAGVILCFLVFFCLVDFISFYTIKALFGIFYGI